jgi:serine/threonine-protein kinase
LLGSVHAETASDPAAARVLFAEGRKLMTEKHYEQACPKFEESLRLDSGIGAMFNLADCWEHSGRSASAWGMFLDTAAAARAAGQSDRVKVAKDRAAKLEPKLAKLTIRLARVEQGLELRRDGQVVGQASYDVPVPVDPGTHRVEVAAPGKTPYSTAVEVGASASVSVQVPALEDASATPAVAAPSSVVATTAPTATTTDTTPEASGKRSRVLPYSLAGVGVVGLAIGTVFAIKSRSANGDALDLCPADAACSQADIDRHDGLVKDAKSDQLIAIVGAGVGAASLITAVVLIVTEPRSGQIAGFSWDFDAGPHGGAIFAKGRF